METVLYNNKNTVKILKMIFMNYIRIILHNKIRWLRQNRFYRDIASWREYLTSSALSDIYRAFIPAFGLFYTKVLCPVFFWSFSECSQANMLFCVCFRARTTHFTFTLCLLKFPEKHAKQQFKRPKPTFIGWICDSLNQSEHGRRD